MPGTDDGGDGAASTARSKLLNCSVVADNLVTIIFQNTDDSLFSGGLDLSNIHYRSNVGDVLEVLLRRASALSGARMETFSGTKPMGARTAHSVWRPCDCPATRRTHRARLLAVAAPHPPASGTGAAGPLSTGGLRTLAPLVGLRRRRCALCVKYIYVEGVS